jgi:hypothetical protein
MALAMLAGGCSQDPVVTTGAVPRPSASAGTQADDPVPVPAAAAPSIKLRVYPDMAVPGSTVAIEAQLVPPVIAEEPKVSFRTVQDPCDGEIVQDGYRAEYKVPAKCHGSAIVVEVAVTGSFGELTRSVKLDIKKSIRLESVVISSPQPNERVASPVLLLWDRTLYENRKETLSFRTTRGGKTILQTRDFTPDAIVELDVPPSPDPLTLHATVAGGSTETATLRVFERVAPQSPPGGLVLDRFDSPDGNASGAARKILTTGGQVVAGMGTRVTPQGEGSFFYMGYHVRKASRMERGETVMGIEEEVLDSSATTATYDTLRVWLKGDPVHGFTTPVYVEVAGSFGHSRKFKIVRMRPQWTEFRFPLKGPLRSPEDRVRKVRVFVDSKDVYPPLSHIFFGGLYLAP